MKLVPVASALMLTLLGGQFVGVPESAISTTYPVSSTLFAQPDDCQLAFIARCVALGGDYTMCEAASASYACP